MALFLPLISWVLYSRTKIIIDCLRMFFRAGYRYISCHYASPLSTLFYIRIGSETYPSEKIIRHLKISDPFFYYRLLFWNRRPPKNFDCFATLEGPGPFIAGEGVWAFAVLQCLSKFFIFLSIVKRFDYNFDFIPIISVYDRIFFTESTFLSEGKKKL